MSSDIQKLSYYISKAKSLNKNDFEKKIKIGLLSSFTINGLEETLRVLSFENEIDCRTYLGNYNQYNQNILDEESDLYKFNPDFTILIIDTRSLFGDLFFSPYTISSEKRVDYVNNRISEIKNLIETFLKRSQSKLILSTITNPTYSPYGIFETKVGFGLQKMVTKFNDELINLYKDNSSVFIYDLNQFILKFGEKNVFDYKQFFLGDIKISTKKIFLRTLCFWRESSF